MTTWRRSSRCKTPDRPTECIEIAALPGRWVSLRTSTSPTQEIIATKTELSAFFDGVKAGEFDDLL